MAENLPLDPAIGPNPDSPRLPEEARRERCLNKGSSGCLSMPGRLRVAARKHCPQTPKHENCHAVTESLLAEQLVLPVHVNVGEETRGDSSPRWYRLNRRPLPRSRQYDRPA